MNKMKVLSIDDNPQNLKLIQQSLEKKFDVLSDLGPGPFDELLSRFNPDVILLDIILGSGCGYDVCRQLRESNICPDVVVIFISSLDSLENKMDAYAAGGDDYICKPFNLEELGQKLHSLSKRVSQQRGMAQIYNDATQVAYSSMQQSNELGQLLAFFTETSKINDCKGLFDATARFVRQFAGGCVLEFRMGEQTMQFPQQRLPPLESEILELGRSAKRIITFGQNLLLNSDWCSLLIKKMPCHDDELCGRLRDNYAILLGIIDNRLMLFDSQQNSVKEREKAIVQLSGSLDSGLGKIKNELQQQEQQIQSNIHQLVTSINIGLVTLGLSEDQENALLGIVGDTQERFDNMVELSINIDKQMCQFDRLLGKIN